MDLIATGPLELASPKTVFLRYDHFIHAIELPAASQQPRPQANMASAVAKGPANSCTLVLGVPHLCNCALQHAGDTAS